MIAHELGRWQTFTLDVTVNLVLGVVVVLFGVRWVAGVLQLATDATAAEQEDLAQRLRGGAWIGALERLATYVTILAGFPAGLAVIAAIKGLARYPDLREQDALVSERFIIGTFVSMLLAIGAAALARWITGLW